MGDHRFRASVALAKGAVPGTGRRGAGGLRPPSCESRCTETAPAAYYPQNLPRSALVSVDVLIYQFPSVAGRRQLGQLDHTAPYSQRVDQFGLGPR